VTTTAPISYNQFRTGYSWQEVREMVWGQSDDPSTWPLAHHTNRRHTVLGKWRQINAGDVRPVRAEL
jgi:hypothetical protein